MKIIAKILKYLIDDLHFDYDDGSFEWFDGIKLRVIKPENIIDSTFYLFHDPELSDQNPWNAENSHVEFEIDDFNDLKKGHFFTAGLKKVKFDSEIF